MSNAATTIHQLFSFLEGTWTGEGRGEFPGVTSFAYRETLTFARRDENSLDYEQKTQKRYDGQTDYQPSHGERGSIRVLENGELELVNEQRGGRSEVLVGSVEMMDNSIRIHFVSKTLSNDPRMISSARTFELEGDTLRYEMGMHTTRVAQLTSHLRNTLQRDE